MARSTTARSSAGLRRVRAVQAGDDGGFTLLESVVSLAIFAIVAITAAWGIIQALQLTNLTSHRVGGLNIAQQELERLRQENGTSHALVLTPAAGTVPTDYSVTETATDCASGTRTLQITVTWGDATHPVVLDTELSC